MKGTPGQGLCMCKGTGAGKSIACISEAFPVLLPALAPSSQEPTVSEGLSWGPGCRREPFRDAAGSAQPLHLILGRARGVTGREVGEAGGHHLGLAAPLACGCGQCRMSVGCHQAGTFRGLLGGALSTHPRSTRTNGGATHLSQEEWAAYWMRVCQTLVSYK